MGEQDQSTGTAGLPAGAVLTEVQRIVRVVDRHAPGGYAAAAMRAVRDSVAPGLTTTVWREWVRDSRIAAEIEESERQEQQRAERQARQARINERASEIAELLTAAAPYTGGHVPALRDLYNSHGYYIEGNPGADSRYIAGWEAHDPESVVEALADLAVRANRPVPERAPDAPAVAPDTSEEEEPGCSHPAVQCDECRGTGCAGFDNWGDPQCSTSCPDCEYCEYEHSCRECGLSGDCSHMWRCTECEASVGWSRTERAWIIDD